MSARISEESTNDSGPQCIFIPCGFRFVSATKSEEEIFYAIKYGRTIRPHYGPAIVTLIDDRGELFTLTLMDDYRAVLEYEGHHIPYEGLFTGVRLLRSR